MRLSPIADILFKTEDYVFSYRVAGILVRGGKVLLQKLPGSGYAFPGGHVELGKTNKETLIREFKEEIGAKIRGKDIKWVAEIFFLWDHRPCHQICLYYIVELTDETQIPLDGGFAARERIEKREFDVAFHWIPLETLKDIEVYPGNAGQLMKHLHEGVSHFVWKD